MMRCLPCCTVALCCFLCVVLGPVSGFFLTSRRSSQAVPLSTFKLTSIGGEPQGDGYTVRLQLTGDHLPKVYHIVASEFSQQEAKEVPVSSDGSVEFFSQSVIVEVILVHPRGSHMFYARLKGTQQQQVPDIDLFLNKGTEVTFAKGQAPVDVNVTLRARGPYKTSFYLDRTFARINRTDPTFVTKRGRGAVLQEVDEGESSVESFVTLRVNSSAGEEAEGVLEINGQVNFRCDNSAHACVMRHYAINQQIPVYMTGHSGPFPPGYLGFVDGEVEEFTYCSLHGHLPCTLNCPVMGDRPSPVEIVRVDRGSGLQVVSQFAVNTDYWSMGQLVFANLTRGMTGTFRCSSRSGSGLGEVSRLIRYDAVYDAQITDTFVERLDNVTEITCKAKGTPTPHLLFKFSNETEIDDDFTDGNNAINVTKTHDDVMPEAVLRMDTELANQIGSVTCLAINIDNFRSYEDSSFLYVGDPDNSHPDIVRYHLENVVYEK